ncbi:hypothetical protein D3C76_791580 [compost metagenome]
MPPLTVSITRFCTWICMALPLSPKDLAEASRPVAMKLTPLPPFFAAPVMSKVIDWPACSLSMLASPELRKAILPLALAFSRLMLPTLERLISPLRLVRPIGPATLVESALLELPMAAPSRFSEPAATWKPALSAAPSMAPPAVRLTALDAETESTSSAPACFTLTAPLVLLALALTRVCCAERLSTLTMPLRLVRSRLAVSVTSAVSALPMLLLASRVTSPAVSLPLPWLMLPAAVSLTLWLEPASMPASTRAPALLLKVRSSGALSESWPLLRLNTTWPPLKSICASPLAVCASMLCSARLFFT